MPRRTLDDLLDVRHSAIHGRGVFARRHLRAGDVIGRYTGRRYAPEEIGEREWDPGVTYVFGLSDGSLIDGAEGGNATRFLNHSCTPNCQAWEIEDEHGGLDIEIVALREIAAGDELFIDYGLDAGGADPSKFACRCGAADCRGSLLAA